MGTSVGLKAISQGIKKSKLRRGLTQTSKSVTKKLRAYYFFFQKTTGVYIHSCVYTKQSDNIAIFIMIFSISDNFYIIRLYFYVLTNSGRGRYLQVHSLQKVHHRSRVKWLEVDHTVKKLLMLLC